MNGVDTNILVYCIDTRDLDKLRKARALIGSLRNSQPPTVLLWQVAGELTRQLRAWSDKGELRETDIRRYLDFFRRVFPLTMPTPQALDRALDLAQRFSLSHWDSMLLGACVEAGVDTLFTEDMGAPTMIGSVRLISPF
jgi:predicted nucleic acid-binding protein